MRYQSTLGYKFVAFVAAILVLTLGTSATWFLTQQQRLLEEQLHERGQLLGHFASLVSAEAILAYDFIALQNYVEDVSAKPDIVLAMIFDAEGRPLTNYLDSGNPQLHRLQGDKEHKNIQDLLVLAEKSSEFITKRFPIEHQERPIGELVITLSKQRLDEELQESYLRQITIYLSIILFLSVAIYLVFLLNVLKPVRELILGSRRIASGQYDVPVKVTSSDELGLLTAAFNDMMEDVREDQELLNYQANYDDLTGLPNRVLAMEVLHKEIALAKRLDRHFAIIFMDLNNFKLINDTMGHKAGDKLLIALSARFRSVLRETDTLARLGGDEFLLLMPTASEPESIREASMRLLDSLSTPINIGEHEIFINCSLGVALYPDDGTSAQELMANADNAMYQAKRSHSEDLRFFAPEMNQVMKERMELEHDLQLAILRNQFLLHYQPITEVASQKPAGAEVLLRWAHPEKGLIPPDTFIPLAETTGKIITIGKWVIRTAVAQCRKMIDAGLDPGYISVNVSRIQLNDEFPEIVEEALKEWHLDANHLRLEVTESALMENSERQSAILRKLDSIGVKLLLDDFGTGFSSLSYLKHYPFHTLKIDKSFIDGIPDDDGDASLVRGIIAMSQGLGLGVVAEGVEFNAQYQFLSASRVDCIQGYLFARPMPADEFESYLKKPPNRP